MNIEDVKKLEFTGGAIMNAIKKIPVSYTHLDVYKRQAPKSAQGSQRRYLQYGKRGWGYFYERYGFYPGLRPCGKCADHRRGRGL